MENLYNEKVKFLINKINQKNIESDIDLLELPDKVDNTHSKTFLIQTVSNIKYLYKNSTKLFTNSKYYLYIALKNIWTTLDDTDKNTIWKTLNEMLVTSVDKFPIVKTTNYYYLMIILCLKNQESDVPLPSTPVLHIFSACLKETILQIKDEIKQNKISDNLMERIVMEFQTDIVPSVQQMGKMKTKLMNIIERPEIQYILDIIKVYFTTEIMDIIQQDCDRVFNSDKFIAFKSKYKQTKIMSMIQNQEFTFSYIRQMIIDSGLQELLGDDFECPNSFKNVMELIHKYTGKKFEETDLKGFCTDNISQILEIPQVKKILKNSGYNDILSPFINMFKKRDYDNERILRKEKRQRKKLKKLMKGKK